MGRPLHYSDQDGERRVHELVRTEGPAMEVYNSAGHLLVVPHHYIALHASTK